MTGGRLVRWLRDPLPWLIVALVALAAGMTSLRPLFAFLFPDLQRPVYDQDGFLALLAAHVWLVGVSSGLAVVIGVAAGLFVTRPAGREFRGLFDTLFAASQTIPPVAVLALMVPILGYDARPAIIALLLYGLLPVAQNTVAGLEAVPADITQAARGIGMTGSQLLFHLELPLAAGAIIAGIRTCVIINTGTAAIASTAGVKTLGLPIIVGLAGGNLAYVVQGAALVGLLAVVLDLGFDRVGAVLDRAGEYATGRALT
jgi:osmoprotectant transport system permease protein